MNTKNDNNASLSNECQSRPVRPSFREAFCRAAKQVNLECCRLTDRDQMRELCYIIAEVYIIDPDSKINIADESLDAYLVQEIFGELELHHLELVLENFNKKTEIIHNKRAYLRTALYNSVFEFEAHYQNLANRRDLPGWPI